MSASLSRGKIAWNFCINMQSSIQISPGSGSVPNKVAASVAEPPFFSYYSAFESFFSS